MPAVGRRGLTLVELLVSMVITVLVLGALMSLYVSAVCSYALQTADCSAQAQARQALRSALPYIREVRDVLHAQPDYLRFHLVDPQPTIPGMATGAEMCIYLGEGNGYPNTASGEYLWLAANKGGEMRPVELLAKGIAPGAGLQFTYVLNDGMGNPTLAEQDVFRLRAIRMTVATVQYTQGEAQYVVQEGTAVLRSYSPE